MNLEQMSRSPRSFLLIELSAVFALSKRFFTTTFHSGSFISCQCSRNSANVPWANRRNRARSSSSIVFSSKIAYCDGPRCSGGQVQILNYNRSCINASICDTIKAMALREESPPGAELHFEGNSLEVLSSFPDDVKRSLGFSLRQLQIGREPTSQTRSMSSIGAGVYELKEADERAWYRVIYLSKIENRIYVLPPLRRRAGKRTVEI
jgi:phage-related protein